MSAPQQYNIEKVNFKFEKREDKRIDGKILTKAEITDKIWETTKLFAIAGLCFGSASIAVRGMLKAPFYTVAKRSFIADYKRTFLETIETIGKSTLLFTAVGLSYSFGETFLEEKRQKNDVWNGVLACIPASLAYSLITRKQPWKIMALCMAANFVMDDPVLGGFQHERERLTRFYGPKNEEIVQIKSADE